MDYRPKLPPKRKKPGPRLIGSLLILILAAAGCARAPRPVIPSPRIEQLSEVDAATDSAEQLDAVTDVTVDGVALRCLTPPAFDADTAIIADLGAIVRAASVEIARRRSWARDEIEGRDTDGPAPPVPRIGGIIADHPAIVAAAAVVATVLVFGAGVYTGASATK